MRSGPFQQGGLLVGDPRIPQGRPAIGRGDQSPALGIKRQAGNGALMGKGAFERRVRWVEHRRHLASRVCDQSTLGGGRDRVDPAALRIGQRNDLVRARPDQLAVVAAGDDPLTRRMPHRAQHRPVMSHRDRAVLEPDRAIAQGKDGTGGGKQGRRRLGIKRELRHASTSPQRIRRELLTAACRWTTASRYSGSRSISRKAAPVG